MSVQSPTAQSSLVKILALSILLPCNVLLYRCCLKIIGFFIALIIWLALICACIRIVIVYVIINNNRMELLLSVYGVFGTQVIWEWKGSTNNSELAIIDL